MLRTLILGVALTLTAVSAIADESGTGGPGTGAPATDPAKGLVPIVEVFEPAPPENPEPFGKVAVIQWAPSQDTPVGVTAEEAEAVKAENRRTLTRYIFRAAANGAEMVITPEFAILGYPNIPELPPAEDEYRNRADIAPYVEPVPGPSTEYFARVAGALGIYLHIGLAEVDPLTDLYYNTVVAFDPQGQIVGKYRKLNLYGTETNFLSPGSETVTYESPFGKVGILICADVYEDFPLDDYYEEEVDVLALSTSWVNWNTGMETFVESASAMGAYLLAANQPYFPDSGVINPDGSLQSHIRQSQGIAYGYLPRKAQGASSFAFVTDPD